MAIGLDHLAAATIIGTHSVIYAEYIINNSNNNINSTTSDLSHAKCSGVLPSALLHFVRTPARSNVSTVRTWPFLHAA
jgi:hypothetical protein